MIYTTLAGQVTHSKLHLSAIPETAPSYDPSKPCRLRELPDEIKLEIMKYLDQRRDLYNFSLTCRALEDLTLSRLYQSINVDIPHTETSLWNFGQLPVFRPCVLRYMKELTVKNGIVNKRDPIYHKRRRSDASSADAYVRNIVKCVPEGQLNAFSFLHQTPVSFDMLDVLSRLHGQVLNHFYCCELEVNDKSRAMLPSNLRTFECRSVHNGVAVSKMILANKSTLVSLRLGQDQQLIEQYRSNRISFLSQMTQPSEQFASTLDLSSMPNLKTLSFSGLDLAQICPRTLQESLLFTQIESLTIDSCPNSALFLDVLAQAFVYIQESPQTTESPLQTQLKQFSFRHELFTQPLKTSLLNFLTSFSGLTSLSILIENTTLAERPATFLQNHGETLQTLVLECRIQPRISLTIDTSRPFGSNGSQPELWTQSIGDIITYCPNLVELGMAFPWSSDGTISIQPRSNQTVNLSTLKHLKTIHVRNFPSSQTLSQLGDYTIREHALKFLEWCYSSSPASSSTTTSTPTILSYHPTLETLAIGPTLHTTRWRTGAPTSSFADRVVSRPQPIHPSYLLGFSVPTPSSPSTPPSSSSSCSSNTKLPEYLRTHYFCLDWARTRFGRWTPMVSGVGERYMEEIRGQKGYKEKGQSGLGGCFEPVWLR